ncbi:unnamed protein product, partial [Ectocarpus fasciculatus]
MPPAWIRWVNLWPSQSFSEGVASRVLSDEPEPTSGEDDGSGDDGDETQRGISLTIISDVGSLLFMGNFALFAGLLVTIFSLHILVASAVEAYWLAKQRATEEAPRALRGDLSTSEFSAALLGTPSQQQQLDDSLGRKSSGTIPSPQQMERQAISSRGSTGRGDSTSNEEESGRTNTRAGSSIGQVSECRELSQSAWLHYPHLELVFLFFAFEGAVTSQVSALRSASSSTVFYAALATLVLYPVLMVAMVVRTHRVRLRSDTLIVFKSNESDEASTGKSLFSKMIAGSREDSSLFAWADKGQWETVQTEDEDAKRNADWFRIGFEPLYADFTQAGSWFIIYTLIEWAALACIAVLVDNSAVQFGLFCAIHSMTFIVVVACKPFANRWVP